MDSIRIMSEPPRGEFGELIAVSTFAPDPDIPDPSCFSRTGLVVTRADPRIRVSRELVETLRAAPEDALFGRRFAEVCGDVLRIFADNGTWVYRLGPLDEPTLCYEAEFPD